MAQDANVDMIGFDYFRPDTGGFEISDLFANQMPVNLPAGFHKWPRHKRWAYIARKVEYEWRRDPDFYEQWNWFRAHLVSEHLKQIVNLSGIRKPLWVFMFGWYHGQQIGQDPLMLTDAGADALAVMLYQISSPEHFRLMTTHWSQYMQAGNCNLLPGDQVDFYWHQRLIRPRAAPEELYRRIVTAHMTFQKGSVCQGVFLHDISRLLSGNLGPYPGREWALSGAAAFSTIRGSWKVYPLSAQLILPQRVSVGIPFEARIRVKSISRRPVSEIQIRLEETQQVETVGPESKSLSELPGRSELEVPFEIVIGARNERRGNRFMVAFRITWADGDYGEEFRRDAPRTIVVMRYLDAE
jgi:hypothetical protein